MLDSLEYRTFRAQPLPPTSSPRGDAPPQPPFFTDLAVVRLRLLFWRRSIDNLYAIIRLLLQGIFENLFHLCMNFRLIILSLKQVAAMIFLQGNPQRSLDEKGIACQQFQARIHHKQLFKMILQAGGLVGFIAVTRPTGKRQFEFLCENIEHENRITDKVREGGGTGRSCSAVRGLNFESVSRIAQNTQPPVPPIPFCLLPNVSIVIQ